MRRYLLVLDKDLITADDQSSPEPIRYLAARQEEEPCEVVVLSLVRISQPRLPLVTRSGPKSTSIDPLTRANLGKHDASAAKDRMNSAVHLLEQVGCHAMGVVSRQQQVPPARRRRRKQPPVPPPSAGLSGSAAHAPPRSASGIRAPVRCATTRSGTT